MKKQIKSLFLVALLVGMTTSVWAQSTTEGKEFWVALTLSAAPSSGTPSPFIAVSTKKQTKITITNPNDPGWAGITRTVGANQWEVFDDIPLAKWYPTSANSINNIKPQAGQTHDFGLKVVTDEDVSVYAALWMLNSFDAANILPVHVLQYEYYTQDYPPYIKPSDGDALSMFTILATQDGTRITITPSSETQDGHAAGVPYFVTLNAGQTYYVISKTLQSLSGTHVTSNDQKIAIFQGDVFTQIPGGKAARDCLYEQAMPVDYWGTKFVVTRSKEKDANRVRVTASNNGTSLYIKGKKVASINAGQTWEFEMRKNPMNAQGINMPDGEDVLEDAIYLEASCPVAVYSYDVSNGYSSTPSEMDSERGDPSMVWISPLEQRISDITFGVCGTSKTDKHYIDIVCQTEATSQTTITPSPAEAVTWTKVPGNDKWSYARVHLSTAGKKSSGESASIKRVFRLENPMGCIAHVYGNGNDESYSYSVGSAAVKMGVNMEGTLFQDGAIPDKKFCMEDGIFSFDANVGTDEIKRVDWNFGDGTILTDGPAQIDHEYKAQGWYDVEAKLYGVPPCSGEDIQYIHLGDVRFSFEIVLPQYTIGQDTIICDNPYKTPGTSELDTFDTDVCWRKIVKITRYGMPTKGGEKDTIRTQDTYTDPITGITYPHDPMNPADYYVDTVLNLTADYLIYNQYGCDSTLERHIRILTCLDMDVPNDSANQFACQGDEFVVPYTHRKGEMESITALIGGEKVPVTVDADNKLLVLPTKELKPGRYTTTIYVVDKNCERTIEFPLNFAILYSAGVFAYKYNNLLAVYSKEYNGGYDFTGFQWYYENDAIPGANAATYHTDGQLPEGKYYVELTNKEGITLRSCSQNIVARSFPTEVNLAAPALKLVRDGQFLIQIGNAIYDIYGQKVK